MFKIIKGVDNYLKLRKISMRFLPSAKFFNDCKLIPPKFLKLKRAAPSKELNIFVKCKLLKNIE